MSEDTPRRTVTDGGNAALSRRHLMATTGAAMLVAGCLGDEDPEPISLDGERACDRCGMIIEDHPGPVGQIHFEDDEPEGGRPAQFCSSVCTYTYRFNAEEEGRTPRTTFLTDYSRVEEEVFESGSDLVISSHVEADAFAPTTELTLVVGSEVSGAMGPALVPFSDGDDLTAFIDEYGGADIGAESIDRATVENL